MAEKRPAGLRGGLSCAIVRMRISKGLAAGLPRARQVGRRMTFLRALRSPLKCRIYSASQGENQMDICRKFRSANVTTRHNSRRMNGCRVSCWALQKENGGKVFTDRSAGGSEKVIRGR